MSPVTLAWAHAAAVAGAVVALDQGSKAIVVASLGYGGSVNVFLGLDVTHVRNTGIAFGALAGGGGLIVALVGAALLLLIAYFARHVRLPFVWLPVGMILGGALGNLADRARDGTVIDFIDPIAWPAFNVADIAVVLGVLGIFYVADGPRPHRRAGRGDARA